MLRSSAYAIAAFVALDACAAAHEREVKAATTTYVRTDTDATTIVSPAVQVAGKVSEPVELSATYAVDAWTGASVDVVTAATHAISERRHEGQFGVSYDDGTNRVSARYRGSFEHDYQSHGFVLNASRDFARHNTTLSAAITGSGDTAGRAGDPAFLEPVGTAGLRLGVSQVIDRVTMLDLGVESTVINGYQASPYRFVGVGGDGVCAGSAALCVPEHVPDQRVRNAGAVRLRRAIGEHASVGLDYRYYTDSWGIRSHTVEPELTWLVSDATTLTFHYRYYTQGQARFYRPRYFMLDDADGYLTRDRKLSAFFANELGVSWGRVWELDDGDRRLDVGVRATGSRIDYLGFVGLDAVTALELTSLVGLDF